MAYATQKDITDRYGGAALLIAADRDGDDGLDTRAVADALTDATSEIDSYVAARYDLPLSTVPAVLVGYCVDIAIYRLSATADVATDEQRKRYEDARKWLEHVSSGKVSLGLADPPSTGSTKISVASSPRLFSRAKLRELL